MPSEAGRLRQHEFAGLQFFCWAGPVRRSGTRSDSRSRLPSGLRALAFVAGADAHEVRLRLLGVTSRQRENSNTARDRGIQLKFIPQTPGLLQRPLGQDGSAAAFDPPLA